MIYIAGPVTGYEDGNRPAFEEALRTLGRCRMTEGDQDAE